MHASHTHETRPGAVPAFATRTRDRAVGSHRPQPAGFTLVELLVVIVIIGILAGLTTGGIIAARNAARRAMIKVELGQLSAALEKYKNEVGEYPPDFAGLASTDDDFRVATQHVLVRHIRKRFPRYVLPPDDLSTTTVDESWARVVSDMLTPVGSGGYGVDIRQLDSASALAFWLGGLPENADSGAKATLAGFHADPTQPFKPGTPRTTPYYEFNPDQLEYSDARRLLCRYYPDLPAGIPRVPYVYFRAQRYPGTVSGGTAHTYEFVQSTGSGNYVSAVRCWPPLSSLGAAPCEIALPYGDGNPADTNSPWRNETKYQIICGGLDGSYGERPELPPAPASDTAPAFTTFIDKYPITKTGTNFTEGDYDNQTDFADGKLEDELQ